MPRSMSFFLTTDQIRRRTKSVTRRIGWSQLKQGDHVRAVVKCQGLKAGEKQQRLADLRIVSVRRERLDAILDQGQSECALEGFPNLTPQEFVAMFCSAMRGTTPADLVTRIEFEYVDDAPRLF